MIGMLKGTVRHKDSEKIILEVNGVGYILMVPTGCLAGCALGDEKIFYTHLLVREDDLVLYGFNNQEQKEFFLKLLGVGGIGPKAAISFLSVYSVKQIKSAILTEDISLLTGVPGVGSKTAKRLVLELKEKIKDFELTAGPGDTAVSAGYREEAMESLLALGFSRNEAGPQLAKAMEKGLLSTEDLVRETLRLLAEQKEK